MCRGKAGVSGDDPGDWDAMSSKQTKFFSEFRRFSVSPLLCVSMMVCFLLSPFSVTAAPLPPLEGLEKLRVALQGLQDFSAELTQEKQLSVLKKKLVMKGTVRFRKPDQFAMELLPPYKSRMLLKDNLLLQRIGERGELQKIVLPEDQGLSRWMGKLSKPVSKLPEGLDIKADQSGKLTTVMIRPIGSGQMKEITVQFQDDGLIRRLVLEERNGDRSTMIFSKARKNNGLSDADFRME